MMPCSKSCWELSKTDLGKACWCIGRIFPPETLTACLKQLVSRYSPQLSVHSKSDNGVNKFSKSNFAD